MSYVRYLLGKIQYLKKLIIVWVYTIEKPITLHVYSQKKLKHAHQISNRAKQQMRFARRKKNAYKDAPRRQLTKESEVTRFQLSRASHPKNSTNNWGDANTHTHTQTKSKLRGESAHSQHLRKFIAIIACLMACVRARCSFRFRRMSFGCGFCFDYIVCRNVVCDFFFYYDDCNTRCFGDFASAPGALRV